MENRREERGNAGARKPRDEVQSFAGENEGQTLGEGPACTRSTATRGPVGRPGMTTITLTDQETFQAETGYGRKRRAGDMDRIAVLKGLLESVLKAKRRRG